MARDTLVEGSTLTAIADAIREKTETSDVMYPSEMAGKIRAISAGGIPEPITAGDTIVAANLQTGHVSSDGDITEMFYIRMKKAGTYRFKSNINRDGYTEDSTVGTAYIYVNGVERSKQSVRNAGGWMSFDIACEKNDVVSLYVKASDVDLDVEYFLTCIDWDNSISYLQVVSEVSDWSTSETWPSASGIYVVIPKTGTYDFRFTAERSSTSGTWVAQLYKNRVAISDATVVWNNKIGTYSGQIACNKGDRIEIYGRARGSNYILTVGGLVADEAVS